MVPSDWDWAPKCVCFRKITSNLIGESPIIKFSGCWKRLIYVCGLPHSFVWWSVHIIVWHDLFVHDTPRLYATHKCFIRVCGMTHSCVTWIIQLWNIIHSHWQMTESCVWQDWFMYVMFDMTDSYVWHDSFKCVTFSSTRETWLACKYVCA